MGLTYFRHSFLNTTSVNIEYKICGLIPQKLTVNSFLLHTHTHTHKHIHTSSPLDPTSLINPEMKSLLLLA